MSQEEIAGSAAEIPNDFLQGLWRCSQAIKPERYEYAVAEAEVTERTDERTALRLYIRAIRIAPTESLGYYRLGRLFMKQGRGQWAAKILGHAVALLPTHNQQRLQYARALRLNGQEAEAQREANYVLARNPHNEDAQRVLINHQGKIKIGGASKSRP